MPTRALEAGSWLHPSRLPLGSGWDGHCCAPGHEGVQPSREELVEFCNLGYATSCPRLPSGRDCDAVRFAVARDLGSKLLLWFVCETGHRPGEHGTLEYDVPFGRWIRHHSNPRIQKMAECYLEFYLRRKTRSAHADLIPSTQT